MTHDKSTVSRYRMIKKWKSYCPRCIVAESNAGAKAVQSRPPLSGIGVEVLSVEGRAEI